MFICSFHLFMRAIMISGIEPVLGNSGMGKKEKKKRSRNKRASFGGLQSAMPPNIFLRNVQHSCLSSDRGTTNLIWFRLFTSIGICPMNSNFNLGMLHTYPLASFSIRLRWFCSHIVSPTSVGWNTPCGVRVILC